MQKINVSEFKAVCLRLLEEVRTTGEPIEVLKNGVPLVVVYPPPVRDRKAAFGSMKNTLKGKIGDLVSPIEGVEWDVLK